MDFALRGKFLLQRCKRNQRPRPPSLAPSGNSPRESLGEGLRSQEPRPTIRKLRRRRTVAEAPHSLTTQGLGGPEGEAAKPGLCTPDVRQAFCRTPLGGRGRSPGDFLVLLYLYKSTSPGGETSPSPVPPAGEILRKLKFTGRFLACKGICHVSRSRVPPGQGLAHLADGHRGHGQQEHGEPLATAH